MGLEFQNRTMREYYKKLKRLLGEGIMAEDPCTLDLLIFRYTTSFQHIWTRPRDKWRLSYSPRLIDNTLIQGWASL
jgi:hypothetical protein